ncbi:MAG: GGDEF domain-containing protein [Spirochaetaceae bacterium]|nr:GGDEF domain-containing protein [Spirochaetaceae bacterium]
MNYSEEEIKDSRRRYFFVTAIVIFVIFISIFSYFEYSGRVESIEKLKQSEIQVVKITDISVTNDLKLIKSDLRYLQNAFKSNLLDNIDYDKIANNWLEFSKQRKLYDQIRYITVDGDEKIRINKSSEKVFSIVADKDLQNKADRYYFTKSILLKEGDIYISPLDLNIENNDIEVPYKPMLRLVMPIYKNGKVEGVVALNYLASELLKDLRIVSKSSVGSVSLLNSDGYYLSSDNPSKDWGFMFNKVNDNFKVEFPDAWSRINNGEEEVLNKSGYFFAHKVDLSTILDIRESDEVNSDNIYWIVISVIPRDVANEYYFYNNSFDLMLDIIGKNYVIYLVLFLVSLFIGFLVFINDRYHTRIRNYSRYDSLTNTFNRGYGMHLISKVFSIDNKKDYPITLCYLDINGLKQVNDNLGHNMGSELIISVTQSIKKTVSKDDYVIRLGGDEIIIVFKSKTKEEAEVVWNKIYAKYNEVNETESRPYIISVSHGIAQFDMDDINDPDVAINIVDELMYEEKQRIKENLLTVLR